MSLFNYYCDEVKHIIEEVKPNYPQLLTYEKEWIYFYENVYTPGTPVELEYETVIINPTGSVLNAIPYPYKSAIIKGNTGYRDIGTGEFLETFEKDRNLELVSVKNPVVLTTSNEDGTKTKILTVNVNVEIRGNGEVKDELDLFTGKLTQRIGEVVFDGSEDWQIDSDTNDYRLALSLKHNGEMLKYSQAICDRYPTATTKQGDRVYNYMYIGGSSINLYENPSMTLEEFKSKLKQNPMTFQYQLITESIKTVGLTPLSKPYEGTNHYQLTANIPVEAIIEVPVVSTGKQTLAEINN